MDVWSLLPKVMQDTYERERSAFLSITFALLVVFLAHAAMVLAQHRIAVRRWQRVNNRGRQAALLALDVVLFCAALLGSCYLLRSWNG